MPKSQNPQDRQAPQSGKVENDFNKRGEQRPTQKNEGKRTPKSRPPLMVMSPALNPPT